MEKIVFFDFDGVIADTFTMAREIDLLLYADTPTDADFRNLFLGEEAKKRMLREGISAHDIDKLFDERYTEDMKKALMFPGVADVVRELHSRYTIIIVSLTKSEIIRAFLSRFEMLDCFDAICGSDEPGSKAEKLERLIAAHKTDTDHVVFITDTVADLRQAEVANVRSIAVAWGFHQKKLIEERQPFLVTDAPEQMREAVVRYLE